MIRVVNKRYKYVLMADEVLVYVGRPSVLGNPFPMHNESERDHVIAQYRRWLDAQRRTNSAAWQEVERLALQVAEGKSLALQCFCAPRKCHADVIKSAIEYINNGGVV